MKIFKEFDSYQSEEPLALSLGMFDGVHLGHKCIIDQLLKVGEQKNLKTGILTFWPHPRLVFNPQENLKLLNTLSEKTELLEHYGIQTLFLKEFDDEFRNLTGNEFVEKIISEKLHTKYLIVGHDHVFGKNRSGNFALLEELSHQFNFEVEQMEVVNFHNNTISSTKIRQALSEGNIEEANAMLGYEYPLSGKVIHGKKIGRTIGFPTANIGFDSIKLLPKKGAYIVDVYVKNKHYKGMLSIGTNPTVNGKELTAEVNILDFNEDIYDQNITVKFRKFLHEEIKFESLEQLVEKLKDDQTQTELFFS